LNREGVMLGYDFSKIPLLAKTRQKWGTPSFSLSDSLGMDLR